MAMTQQEAEQLKYYMLFAVGVYSKGKAPIITKILEKRLLINIIEHKAHFTLKLLPEDIKHIEKSKSVRQKLKAISWAGENIPSKGSLKKCPIDVIETCVLTLLKNACKQWIEKKVSIQKNQLTLMDSSPKPVFSFKFSPEEVLGKKGEGLEKMRLTTLHVDFLNHGAKQITFEKALEELSKIFPPRDSNPYLISTPAA